MGAGVEKNLVFFGGGGGGGGGGGSGSPLYSQSLRENLRGGY